MGSRLVRPICNGRDILHRKIRGCTAAPYMAAAALCHLIVKMCDKIRQKRIVQNTNFVQLPPPEMFRKCTKIA